MWAGTPSYGKTTDLSSLQTADLISGGRFSSSTRPEKTGCSRRVRLSGIHFFLARARKSPKSRHSIHYPSSCRRKHLILGDIAMVIVKFRPRWSHTWRYALNSLSRPTMAFGRLGQWRSTAWFFKQVQANFGGEIGIV